MFHFCFYTTTRKNLPAAWKCGKTNVAAGHCNGFVSRDDLLEGHIRVSNNGKLDFYEDASEVNCYAWFGPDGGWTTFGTKFNPPRPERMHAFHSERPHSIEGGGGSQRRSTASQVTSAFSPCSPAFIFPSRRFSRFFPLAARLRSRPLTCDMSDKGRAAATLGRRGRSLDILGTP